MGFVCSYVHNSKTGRHVALFPLQQHPLSVSGEPRHWRT
jgi:hypothetical protein